MTINNIYTIPESAQGRCTIYFMGKRIKSFESVSDAIYCINIGELWEGEYTEEALETIHRISNDDSKCADWNYKTRMDWVYSNSNYVYIKDTTSYNEVTTLLNTGWFGDVCIQKG